jgi:hypothetical protein
VVLLEGNDPRCGEDILELLRHPDRRDTGPTRRLLHGQIPPHHIDLAIVLAEVHHWNMLILGERAHRPAERRTDPLPDRR